MVQVPWPIGGQIVSGASTPSLLGGLVRWQNRADVLSKVTPSFAQNPIGNGAFPHNVGVAVRGGAILMRQGGTIPRGGPEWVLSARIFAKQLTIGAQIAKAPSLKSTLLDSNWADMLIEAGSQDPKQLEKNFRNTAEDYAGNETDIQEFLQRVVGRDTGLLLARSTIADTPSMGPQHPAPKLDGVDVMIAAAPLIMTGLFTVGCAMARSTWALAYKGSDKARDWLRDIFPPEEPAKRKDYPSHGSE